MTVSAAPCRFGGGHESRRCVDHHDVHWTILGPTSPGLPGSPWNHHEILNPKHTKARSRSFEQSKDSTELVTFSYVFTCRTPTHLTRFSWKRPGLFPSLPSNRAVATTAWHCLCLLMLRLHQLLISQAVTYKGNHSFQLVLGNLYELLDGRRLVELSTCCANAEQEEERKKIEASLNGQREVWGLRRTFVKSWRPVSASEKLRSQSKVGLPDRCQCCQCCRCCQCCQCWE